MSTQHRWLFFTAAILAIGLVAGGAGFAPAQELNRSSLPIPQGPFKRRVAPRTKDSFKELPVEVSAPKERRMS